MIKKDKSEGNKYWCEDEVLHYVINSPVDENEAKRLSVGGSEILDGCNAKYVLINLKQSSNFSSSARKTWVSFLKNSKIKKTAIFGGNVFVKTLASFVITATGKKNIRFFNSEEIAKKWIREK